ncbi:MAG: roadblock/LC7 domain-containing protein [Deltaproteobacteria bacterium]|nr:roadblock/LC7 domain-containing protein [Deltaproteobacteria bacterium]
MTIFADILRHEMTEIPGIVGAIFADWEGESVDLYSNVGQTNMKLAGAHWGIIYSQARTAFRKRQLGMIQQMILDFEQQRVVVRRITDEYFVVVAVQGENNLGHTLCALDRAVEKLRRAM